VSHAVSAPGAKYDERSMAAAESWFADTGVNGASTGAVPADQDLCGGSRTGGSRHREPLPVRVDPGGAVDPGAEPELFDAIAQGLAAAVAAARARPVRGGAGRSTDPWWPAWARTSRTDAPTRRACSHDPPRRSCAPVQLAPSTPYPGGSPGGRHRALLAGDRRFSTADGRRWRA
jgi:hypothetical protein